MKDSLIKIAQTTVKDEAFLRRLKNDEVIRKKTFSLRKVTEGEHHRWFLDFIKHNYSFTIYYRKAKIGNIRFEKIKPSVFLVGIAILPEYGGKGIGSVAMKEALNILKVREKKATVIAEVKKVNEPARKFFEKAGFNSDYIGYKYEL